MTDDDYGRLAELRARLRGYLAWAEDAARDAGTTPMQFQLALAVRASADQDGPTVSELAETLLLKHHSVVGLIDRAEAAGLVERHRDADHAARVRVALTADGAALLEQLARRHQAHLAALAPEMHQAWSAFATQDNDVASPLGAAVLGG